VEIREDTPEGSEILEVHATDLDGSSPNNDVIYRITSGARDKFTVNPETGDSLKYSKNFGVKLTLLTHN
jgi:hypothetical protein